MATTSARGSHPQPPAAGTEFLTHGVAPSLARALAARGYDTPTPVQAAVMVPECAGRDLLVSSQTGSGKTIAFGLIIGRALSASRMGNGGPPRALVVAPTRELATQVKTELAWLFREVRAQVHAFTGGTDVGRDARTLKTGVDIAVGTPGRLVDLIERKLLALGGIATLVLDEADEMLDMGFREDLEKILAAAPASRHTHMFSATLPPAIKALARRYQTDPMSVDPRTGVEPGGRVHEDIHTAMHLVAPGDRLPAVVNVLRAAAAERALVFCARRDRVTSLLAELERRGFSVVGLSGEMPQGERNRSLAALREGRAAVLVATDVAARGLDLPELALVIHADLPVDPGLLVHRSGRTGRAGRKGVSVLIAETTERYRAERLLRAANIQIRWTAVPPPGEILRADRERLLAAIAHEAASMLAAGGKVEAESLDLADRLLAGVSPQSLVAVLVSRARGRLPAPELLRPVFDASPPRPKKHAPAGAPSWKRGPPRRHGKR